MSRNSDIRNILLFTVGILFFICPPVWFITMQAAAEKYDYESGILVTIMFFGILLIGKVIHTKRGN